MTDHTEELLPCPCCGGTELDYAHDASNPKGSDYIMCNGDDGCGLMISAIDAPGMDMTSAWNRRTQQPASVAVPELVETVAFLMEPDLYEPYVSLRRDAHCNGSVQPLMTINQHNRILAALKGRQAAQQDPVAHRLINGLGEVMTDWHDGSPPANFTDLCGQEMKGVRVELAFSATPKAQDVAALVEALESVVAYDESAEDDEGNLMMHYADMLRKVRNALAAHRQAQRPE